MDSFASILIGWTVLIVLMEGAMWHIYHKKMTHLCLPVGTDLSFLRFFTIARMRIFVLLYTLTLLAIIYYFTVQLW